jgi:hypothetical protein
MPQYSTFTQYNPPAPIIPRPELDYTELARHYLKEEPKAVRERMLLEDAPKTPPKEETKLLKDATKKKEKNFIHPLKSYYQNL